MVTRPGRTGRTVSYQVFAERYGEYLPRVLNYMRLRVGDEQVAEDLAALTFERALSRLRDLRDPDAFGGWLFSIARSVVAGYYRRRRPLASLESLEQQAAADDLRSGASVEGLVERSQEVEALYAALATLSEREQEIIRLRFVAGLTNRAIGLATRLREGHVAVILYRALRKVRRVLVNDGEIASGDGG